MRSTHVGLYFLAGVIWGQQYVISTYAGAAPPATPARGVDVSIGYAWGVAADARGNAYFASSDLNCVFKLDRAGMLTRVAGNARPGFSGDGGPATSAQLQGPGGVAVDRAGNLFIADAGNYRIRRVSPSGIITTIAGNGTPGLSGDGGPATSAQLHTGQFPEQGAIATDNAGNLFIASGNSVRKVSVSGIITTVSGSVPLYGVFGVAVDASGDLFIADRNGVREIFAGGTAAVLAGAAALSVAVDGAGNVFYVEYPNRVRKISTGGTITAVAGNGTSGFSGDGGPATDAQLYNPAGVAVDGDGNIFIVGPVAVRKVSPDGIITLVAGNGWSHFSGDGGPAINAQLNDPSGLAVDGAGNLFIADNGNGRIRKISPTGIITTVAENGANGLAADKAGNLYIAVPYRLQKLTPDGVITTVAGNGTPGFSGDGGPAINAQLNGPCAVAVDGAGNLFLGDPGNYRIRKVSSDGIITTIAGNGTPGFSGDGGPAINAQLNGPCAVAVDGAGNLYFSDSRRVRLVSASGTISTVAGNGSADFSGDGGPAINGSLYSPWGIALDGAGNLFIADYNNSRVRRVSNGIITTVAGNGAWGNATCCFSGEGGPAANAALTNPEAVAVDAAGNVFVADAGDYDDGVDLFSTVRILRPVNQTVLISAVVDAASQRAGPVSPGKILVVYGGGLGPRQLIQNELKDGRFGMELGGTTVFFNRIPAPILYVSATQVAIIVPYALGGSTAEVTVAYEGETSVPFNVPITPSSPSLFTANRTGAGQAAAINAVDGTVNSATNPVRIGGYISLYATGEGQTAPGGVDGKLGGSAPILTVRATVDGIPAMAQYAGGAPGEVSGLMQVNVQIPRGVQPGGYVDVVLQVGDESTTAGAVWIAVGQ